VMQNGLGNFAEGRRGNGASVLVAFRLVENHENCEPRTVSGDISAERRDESVGRVAASNRLLRRPGFSGDDVLFERGVLSSAACDDRFENLIEHRGGAL